MIVGAITIFKIRDEFEIVHTLSGDSTAQNIGMSLQMKFRPQNRFGLQTIEVFYDNKMELIEETDPDATDDEAIQQPAKYQYKIGRLSILDPGYGTPYFHNDYNAFIPFHGIYETEAHGNYSVFKERIAFKHPDDLHIVFGHLCSYDEYYTDLGKTSTLEYCQPCPGDLNDMNAGFVSIGL